ncbi:MAG: transcription termination factor Rho [Luteolibacter sp.]
MSNTTNQESQPQLPLDTAAPAAKRATKKTAAKKTTKTAAKKTTAKVAAVKEPVAQEAVVKEPTVKKTAVKKTATKKVAAKKIAAKAEAPPAAAEQAPAPPPEIKQAPAPAEPPSGDGPPRRFGRVPGGGPIQAREPAPPRPPAAPESIPFPTAVAPQPASVTPPEPSAPRAPENQDRPPQGANPPRNGPGQAGESRSKRRRDKRKRRKQERGDPQGQAGHNPQNQNGRQRHERSHPPGPAHDHEDRRPMPLNGPKIEADGLLELAPKGFGFLRIPGKNFEQARDDVFVTPETIRKYNLRLGQWIHGLYQEGPRGPQLVEITRVNDMPPEEACKLPHFDELKAINPTRRISFETTPERFTTRIVDIMAPVGRGQRGLIVSPPRSGKTTLLLHMAEAIREKYDEAIHLMVVLVDERPEEVTEFRRALPGAEIYASSNDEQARNHTRIAEIAIERAKRLVEAGKDVFLIMDSITRLARAYNAGMGMNSRGRGTGSGGITIGALEVPRRLFAAARNTRGGGSLTILATALIQTNSRADEAIYMEFKGTGNMELVLDRKIAENYIYPAADIFKSGTRREELLLADHMLHKIHLIRRGLSGHRPAEAMERLLFFLKKFPNNPQMLMEIKG